MKVIITYKNPANHSTDVYRERYKTDTPVYIDQQEFMSLTQDFDIDVEVISMTEEDPNPPIKTPTEIDVFPEPRENEPQPTHPSSTPRPATSTG